MVRTGRVVDIKGGLLSVCFERPEACQHCNQCGTAHHTFIEVAGDAQLGDFVDIEMPDAQVVRASMLAYLIPLVGLLVGMMLGSVLFVSELVWAACGIVMMALSALALWRYDKYLRKQKQWQPRLVAINKEEKV